MDELLQENGDALLLETGGTDAILLDVAGGGGAVPHLVNGGLVGGTLVGGSLAR